MGRPRHMPEKDVLIVDDEVDVRDVLGEILRDNGYDVDQVATAAEARKLLDAHSYAVALVDWRLPDGDGTVIASIAVELGSQAFVMSGYLRNMLPGNIDPRWTIMKPIKCDELLATVRACIATAAPRAR